jgi:hypothetical protein
MSPNSFFLFKLYRHSEKGWPSKFVMSLHPDTRICPQSKSCTGIQKWLRAKLYRDRCSCLRLKSSTGIRFWSPKTLYRDSAVCRRKVVPGYAKTTPCFAHYSSGGIIFIARIQVTASIRLSNVY